MQEETIKFLTEYKKYRVLWWGFGPTLLEDLCREKNFDVTEFLAKKDKYQCAELLMAFGERKKYWWWPWSKKITDTTFNKTTCRRAFEYHQYSWFWRVIFGLFTPILVHRQVLKWINIGYGGYMYRSNNQTIIKSYLTIAADFNTVGGTLKSLGFPELLQQLDDSLELVRRNMKTVEQHRKFVTEMNKKVLKSSLKVHPDKVNAGDDKQKALNACRALINNTSEFFLDYIHADFKYECYNKMTINSLGVINLLNVRFLAKLGPVSRTKQEEIITHTNKFLKASRSSLAQFIASRSCEGYSSDWAQYTFEQHRDDALNCLTLCIEGCEKFDSQCEDVLEECRQDAKLHDLLYTSIFNMSYKNNKQLEQLYKLKEFANNALQGTIGIINMREMDEYMVLPFAMYVGALALCSNAPAGKKDDDISCLWWVIEKIFSCVPANMLSVSLSSPFFSLDIGKKGENLNKVLINLASYLDVRKEISVSKFVDAIEIISNKLAENFDLDHYKPITVAFYLEESRELAERIEEFVKRAAEDLERAKKIRQDQEKIGQDQAEIRRDQVEIRKGFEKIAGDQEKIGQDQAEIRKGFEKIARDQEKIAGVQDKLSKDQDKFIEEMQNVDAILAVLAQPSSSLSGVEPEHHSQSMSKD